MSFVSSSTTVNLEANLTDIGRRYLFAFDEKTKEQIRFDKITGEDLFSTKFFSIHDSDTNYKSNQILESGDIPNYKGTESTDNLATCYNVKLKNYLVNTQNFNLNATFDRGVVSLQEKIQTVNFNVFLEQIFQSTPENIKFLVYIDTINTDYEHYTLDGAQPVIINGISYSGVMFDVKKYITKYDLKLNINNTNNLNEDQTRNIVFKILPIENCELGFFKEIKFFITGILQASRIISFDTGLIQVNNTQNTTTENFINLSLSNPEYKKIKRSDIEISYGDLISGLTNQFTIELMKSGFKNSPEGEPNTIIKTDQDIKSSTLISIEFDKLKDRISFKVTKPFLYDLETTVQKLQKEIIILQNQIQELIDKRNQLNQEISDLQNQLQTLLSLIQSLNNQLQSLSVYINQATTDLQLISHLKNNLNYSTETVRTELVSRYNRLSEYNHAYMITPGPSSTRIVKIFKFWSDLETEVTNLRQQAQNEVLNITNERNNLQQDYDEKQNLLNQKIDERNNLNLEQNVQILENEIIVIQNRLNTQTSVFFDIKNVFNSTQIGQFQRLEYKIITES